MFGFDDRDKYDKPFGFRLKDSLEAPNYGNPRTWALHPKFNKLKAWPLGYGPMPDPVAHPLHPAIIPVEEAQPLADVFFIHPTTHRGLGEEWNAGWDNEVAQAIADAWPLQHQASVFRGCGRVFAPRYRQAHLRTFYLGGSDGLAALDLAYSDIKRAFQWYLEHEDKGMPLILAGHSQGSHHLIRLLVEEFDGHDKHQLANRLIAAYLPGMQVNPAQFSTLRPMKDPREIGGYLTWMTVAKGHYPDYYKPAFKQNPTINPMTWNDLQEFSSFKAHQGVLNRKMQLRYARTIRAAPVDGLLWIRPLQMPLGSILGLSDWHIADYNLFWANIRNNAESRVRIWHEDKLNSARN